MKNDIIRQNISEHTEHGIIFTNPDFDNSIIGISIDGRVVYDYDLMVNEVKFLMGKNLCQKIWLKKLVESIQIKLHII